MIRVCVVDDQALVRRGICSLLALSGGIEVVGEAADGAAGVEIVQACKPDVLLLDVRMPKLNGIEVVETLAGRGALPPTLLLTTFDDDAAMVAGIKAGARGYLLKGVTPQILEEAISALAAGGTYLYAPLAALLERRSHESSHRHDQVTNEPLTQREREVLKLMASGISNREIADALRLSDGTVRNHVSNVLAKLGVSDRTKAVLRAIELNLV